MRKDEVMAEYKGIDISSYQGQVDFTKVKAAGYRFVIIKAGQGTREFGTFKTNPAYQYLQRAEEAGLDWGAYWWSDAVTVQEAKAEAEAFVKALKGTKPTYPVWMDQEYNSPPAALGQSAQARQLRTEMVKAFLKVLEEAGYYAGLYASKDWLENWVDERQLESYDKWVAQYAAKCTYAGKYGIWQHSGSGRVDGISVPVDLDRCYKDYPAVIQAAGLNGWNKTTEDIPQKPDYKALYEKEKKMNKALEEKLEAIRRAGEWENRVK